MNLKLIKKPLFMGMGAFLLFSCGQNTTTEESAQIEEESKYLSKPLVSHIYTADPSAHVFNGKIYIYPSHDVESEIKQDDSGAHFNMRDYHVFSMDSPDSEPVDHGVILDVDDVPWAKRQMWAPDAAEKDGKYYFYFPAKDHDDIFRIGVAVADSPVGPFKAEAEPIKGSYSMDPAVFQDGNEYYMYWGGIWGGQLQKWRTGKYVSTGDLPYDDEPADDEPAIAPMIAKMSDDMLQFAEEPKQVLILDKDGSPIKAGDHERRFFEAAWVHKHNGKYYFSYSTGDTHNIAYAIGDSPYGPFTYEGVILKPVQGWTNHHSIAKVDDTWYIFYHDTEISGETHLRNIKMAEMTHNEDGTIQTIDPMKKP
ncbi:Xylosidase/arabinosidase [Indibacter alkaliphilus LW1]|uniref:Xylosidase/arabinosidase n=1 Tax=Indibacter alkaliphilus (strain CCUG 57479 / KCTC 22604 / LW1) TaxID=1189612 RepID=S2DI26_INDAL|nr:glycoside hydrolase family 43 protein [Indibacter alkaliphilus]EOZ98657.1 Xylosidase/arabinosidase [Indibacter alkaliphilus LW1]